MGRRKNNPDLVAELIDNRWNEDYSQEEFEAKYYSLSSSDKYEVDHWINEMDKESDRRLMSSSLW